MRIEERGGGGFVSMMCGVPLQVRNFTKSHNYSTKRSSRQHFTVAFPKVTTTTTFSEKKNLIGMGRFHFDILSFQ
jgi:hypothetical protein